MRRRGGLAAACILLLAGAASPAPAEPCTTRSFDESGRVVFVYDGDTVRLADGRRVRLIGIDTPETGRDGRADEPFGVAAREHLRDLLGAGPVGLLRGEQPKDRYGRHLAHLALPDGRDVQRLLLEAGLAVVLAVPPNLRFLDCYLQVERSARARRVGVWRTGAYGPIDATRLSPASRGFRLVRGRVSAVRESRSSVWLEMGQHFSVRVARSDLDVFGRERLRALLERTVTVRGFLYGDSDRAHLTLRHPAMLEVAD